jgi:hypothetical protein
MRIFESVNQQEEASEKLDELLTPIDIGKEINSVKEHDNLYNAEK